MEKAPLCYSDFTHKAQTEAMCKHWGTIKKNVKNHQMVKKKVVKCFKRRKEKLFAVVEIRLLFLFFFLLREK